MALPKFGWNNAIGAPSMDRYLLAFLKNIHRGILCYPVGTVEVVLWTKTSQCWLGKLSDQQRVITNSIHRLQFVELVE